jgi:hypothetical protein
LGLSRGIRITPVELINGEEIAGPQSTLASPFRPHDLEVVGVVAASVRDGLEALSVDFAKLTRSNVGGRAGEPLADVGSGHEKRHRADPYERTGSYTFRGPLV